MLDSMQLSSLEEVQPESTSLTRGPSEPHSPNVDHAATLSASPSEYLEVGLEAAAIGVATVAACTARGRKDHNRRLVTGCIGSLDKGDGQNRGRSTFLSLLLSSPSCLS